jgi:hypothetical protein
MTNQKNYSKGFSRIDKTLNQAAKQYKLEGALNKYQASKYWSEVAGVFVEGARDLTKVMDFNKGVLKVACLSREAAYQIRLLSTKIISALNEVLGKRVVFAIYVEV